MLNVCLPGTGGYQPLPDRWLTCCWAEYMGGAVLIDCGEGTQIALRSAGCKLSRLRLLLITHFHADHISGLPGLLLTLGNNNERKTPLLIAGPPGLRQVVSALSIIAPNLPYPVEVRELTPGSVLEGWNGLSVSCDALAHRVPCYGYRLEVRRPPIFNPQKARALSVPLASYRDLHAGRSVRLSSGKTVSPEEVLDGSRPPIILSYCTDTLPVPQVARLSENADLMIAEGMYGDEAMAQKIAEKKHMLFSGAAHLACKAGAKRLWLTHYSPALEDPSAFLQQTQAIFPKTQTVFDGIRIKLTGK